MPEQDLTFANENQTLRVFRGHIDCVDHTQWPIVFHCLKILHR